MSTSALRSTLGRRAAVVTAATVMIGGVAVVAPSSVVVTASAEAASPTSEPTPPTTTRTAPATAPVTTTVESQAATTVPRTTTASRSSTAVAPYRVGTKAYSKWYARWYMAKRYHWTSKRQYKALIKLWNRESGWNHRSHNSRTGAHGIPQALPGRKMASAGPNWRTNPRTQIKWGLKYIKGRYGTPVRAWAHFRSHGWY